ncbi:hypothetical protein IFM89_008860, partial [Coptis chinensis]
MLVTVVNLNGLMPLLRIMWCLFLKISYSMAKSKIGTPSRLLCGQKVASSFSEEAFGESLKDQSWVWYSNRSGVLGPRNWKHRERTRISANLGETLGSPEAIMDKERPAQAWVRSKTTVTNDNGKSAAEDPPQRTAQEVVVNAVMQEAKQRATKRQGQAQTATEQQVEMGLVDASFTDEVQYRAEEIALVIQRVVVFPETIEKTTKAIPEKITPPPTNVREANNKGCRKINKDDRREGKKNLK